MSYEYMQKALQLLGALTAVSAVSRLLSLTRLYFSPGGSSLNRWKHGKDPYALVTGGTDGVSLAGTPRGETCGTLFLVLSISSTLCPVEPALSTDIPTLDWAGVC